MVYNNGVVEMAGEYIALIANTTFGAMVGGYDVST
jgi:hypothetical protein